MTGFAGFVGDDFKVFAKERWSSHAFNRQRLEIKLKLAALGKELAETLAGFETGLSEERPSVFNQQQVRFLRWFALRPAEERQRLEKFFPSAPPQLLVAGAVDYQRHLQLGVQIEEGGLFCGLFLPAGAALDWRNLRALGGAQQQARQVEEALRALPPQTVVRGAGEGGLSLAGLLAGEGEERELALGRWLEAAAVSLAGTGLAQVLADTLASLLALYRLLAWSRDNDMIGLLRREKQRKQEAAQQLQAGDRVRIIGGIAAGKSAVVEDLDRHGTVKVRLGNLVFSIPVDEIERHEN